jgi:hypothetical protein
MPGLADKSKKIFNALKGDTNANKNLTLLPPAARRKMLVAFAKKQEAAINNFVLGTKGTVLDPSNLFLQKDGQITPPHELAIDFPEDTHTFWINDIKFNINPTDIHISQDSYHIKDWVLRSAGMAKVKSGRGVIFVSVSIPFVHSHGHINGNLRRLIAQVRTIPIVYLENQLIRQVVFPDNQRKNMAAVVTNMNIATHPESTEVLVANVSMEIFNYTPYSEEFLFTSLPTMPAVGKIPTATSNLKGRAAGLQKTTGNANAKPNMLGKSLVVQTPINSLLFTQYYDFILGHDANELNYAIPPGKKNTKLRDSVQKQVKLILDSNSRKYEFTPIGKELRNPLSFTYYVYHAIPQSALGKRKFDSKLSDVSAFSDDQLAGTNLGAAISQVMGVGSKGVNLRKLASGQISGLLMRDKQMLMSNNPGVLTGKRVNATDFVNFCIKTFDNCRYSNKLRFQSGFVDCSAIPYRAAKELGVGNIGEWTVGQVATLETLNAAGVTAYLRLPNGIIVPIPLAINGPARDNASNVSQYGRIPGLLLYRFKKKGVSGHFGNKSVYRPSHVGITAPPLKRGIYTVFEALRPHKDPSRDVRKLNYKLNSFSTTAWQRAYFIPNVVYDYSRNKEEFNQLFGLTNNQKRIQGKGIMSTNNTALGVDSEAIRAPGAANFEQVGRRIIELGLKGEAKVQKISDIQKQLNSLNKRIRGLHKKKADPSFIAGLIALRGELKKQINLANKNAARVTNLQRSPSGNLKDGNKVSKPAVDTNPAKTAQDQALTLAKKARNALQHWVRAVTEFEKVGKKWGWELVWTRDGTAIFRKPVTLTIDPANPKIYANSGLKVATPTQVTVSLNNIFARIPIISQMYVTHQFLGSGDAEVNITFHITGNGPIGQLQYMHKYNETASRVLRRINNVGVINVKNDVINLTGCKDFIIDKMTVSSVPQSPELYVVQLKLTEWKRDQRDRESLKQEFSMDADIRIQFLQRLGKLFNENAKPRILRKFTGSALFGLVTNQTAVSVLQGVPKERLRKLFLEVTLGTGKKVTLAALKEAGNLIAGQKTAERKSQRNSRHANVLDAAYIGLGQIVAKYISFLTNTNVFHFLGWDEASFIHATSDPKHPFFSFGLMEILGRHSKSKLSRLDALFHPSPLFNTTIDGGKGSATLGFKGKRTIIRTFALRRFFNRIHSVASGFNNKFTKVVNTPGVSAQKVQKLRKIYYQNFKVRDNFQEIYEKATDNTGTRGAFSDGTQFRKALKNLFSKRREQDIAIEKFVQNFGKGSVYQPRSVNTSGWGVGAIAGALNTASKLNLLSGVLRSIDQPATHDARLVKAALGPNAGKVVASYPKTQAVLVTDFDTATQKTSTQTVTLWDEIRIEQARLAVALIQYFKRFRNDVAKLGNILQRRLYLHDKFRDLFEKESRDNIKFGGLPAYQDIPLPRAPVIDPYFGTGSPDKKDKSIANTQDRPKKYRWVNPDFFFFNADDAQVTNLDIYAKFGARVGKYFAASTELAYQFGMLPSDKPKTKTVKLDVGGARAVKQGSPGVFAYLGGNLGKHSGEIGHTKTSLANNLPDSLAASHGLQKLQFTIPKGKFANGVLNAGIGDSGVSTESAINKTYIDHRVTELLKSDNPLYQDTHPLSGVQSAPVDRVTFGPSGISESRFPVMLDRRPESIVKTFQKSMVSYQRNTFKMRRAFPAFKLYFIEDDTGSFLGSDKSSFVRSHDDFFSFSAIKEIKFVRSRKVPADLVIIRLSNLFGYLDDLQYSFGNVDRNDPLRPKDSQGKIENSNNALLADTTAENPFTRFILKEGVRVQLRLGYENDPDYLDTEFNGQIVQINQVSADEVVIICQSFATQLVAYKKGLDTKSLPNKWVDTFDLLSWAVCQPEVTYFGRWQLNARRSFGEARSTGGWEKVFDFLADPRDDNIFAPSRHEMITYFADDEGGIFSYIFGLMKRTAYNAGANRKKQGEWVRTIGDMTVYRIDLEKIPVWDPEINGTTKTGSGFKFVQARPSLAVKEGKKTVFYNTYGRGDSGILDYHIYRTTIWDIFKEMELRHPGWIASPVPYGSRMTMFFGQPNQLYWYRPMTISEMVNQNNAMAKLRSHILKDNLLKQLNATIISGKAPLKVALNKIPLVGWAMRNPWTALSYSTFVFGGIFAGGAKWLGGKILGSAIAKRVGLQAAANWTRMSFVPGARGVWAAVGTKLAKIPGAGLVSGTAGFVSRITGLGFAARHAPTIAKVGLGLSAAVTGGVSGARIFGFLGPRESEIAYAQSVISMAQQSYAQRELMKFISGRLIPFRRYHLVTSENHIVANTIKSSVHNTYNAVSLEYTKDMNSAPASLGKPGSMETKSMKASDRILDKDVRMGHFSYPNCRGRWMADRYMQGLLIRYMKDTYKGQLLILGDPKIRPHDRVLVMDSYTGMVGPVDVEQVIHTLTPQTGFLTEITPDLVVYGNNIIDMPYDDYMTAKIAFDRISWSQALDAAIRFDGSQYKKEMIRAGGGPNQGQGRQENKANVDHLNNGSYRRTIGAASNLAANAIGGVGTGALAVGAFAIGGTLAATAGVGLGAAAVYLATRNFNNQLSAYANLTPFFGSMAIKLYEWTTQRQPLLFQPLYLAGRPLLSGVSLDKVGMIQNFRDKFLPVLKNINTGFSVLAQAADSMGLQQFQNYVDQLPLYSNKDETGRAANKPTTR